MGLTCTRCDGTGFLNADQLPAEVDGYDTEAVFRWLKETTADHDVQVCDCCGDGDAHYGTPGDHDHGDYGPGGPYAYNGGLPKCH